MSAALDNPFWHSLVSVHSPLALGSGDILRFPSCYAPFLAVAHPDVTCSADDLEGLVDGREPVFLIGIAPTITASHWRLQAQEPLLQMVFDGAGGNVAQADDDGFQPIELGPGQCADVQALTTLVYPHYFRARTMELGRYFGVYDGTRLAAMIGERMGSPDSREMSAICTHPDFLGRGLAQRLTTMLSQRTLREGRLPYLHVSARNTRAVSVYERAGYRLRSRLGFWSLQRTGE